MVTVQHCSKMERLFKHRRRSVAARKEQAAIDEFLLDGSCLGSKLAPSHSFSVTSSPSSSSPQMLTAQ